jgi:hypothetical protein
MPGYQQSADVMVPPGTTVNQIVQAVLNELNRRQPAAGSMTGMTPASAGPNLNPQFNFGISTPAGNFGFGWNSAQPGQGALSTQSLWGDITGFLGHEGKQILEGVGQQVAQQLPGMIGGLLKNLAASPEFAQYTQQVHAQSAGPGGALAPQFDFGGFFKSAADTIGKAVTQYVIPNLPTIASTLLAVASTQGPQVQAGQGQAVPQSFQGPMQGFQGQQGFGQPLQQGFGQQGFLH